MSHWEITWSIIGHKFIMVLEEVLSRNALTHRRLEFLRCSSPDVTSIVHHLGFALIWKEHLPDLLMSALQLNLLYILCFTAVSQMFSRQMFSRCFMTILCKTNTNTEWHEAAIFFYHRRVCSHRVNNGTCRRTFSPPVRESCLSAVMARKNNILALVQASNHSILCLSIINIRTSCMN